MNIGDIATCGKQCVGVITKIIEKDGVKIYKGFCIDQKRMGKAWQSKNPKVIDNIHKLLNQNYKLVGTTPYLFSSVEPDKIMELEPTC